MGGCCRRACFFEEDEDDLISNEQIKSTETSRSQSIVSSQTSSPEGSDNRCYIATHSSQSPERGLTDVTSEEHLNPIESPSRDEKEISCSTTNGVKRCASSSPRRSLSSAENALSVEQEPSKQVTRDSSGTACCASTATPTFAKDEARSEENAVGQTVANLELLVERIAEISKHVSIEKLAENNQYILKMAEQMVNIENQVTNIGHKLVSMKVVHEGHNDIHDYHTNHQVPVPIYCVTQEESLKKDDIDYQQTAAQTLNVVTTEKPLIEVEGNLESEKNVVDKSTQTIHGNPLLEAQTHIEDSKTNNHQVAFDVVIEQPSVLEMDDKSTNQKQSMTVSAVTAKGSGEFNDADVQFIDEVESTLKASDVTLDLKLFNASSQCYDEEGQLVVFCMHSSRLGTDVQCTLDKIPKSGSNSSALLVIMHNQREDHKWPTNSEHLLDARLKEKYSINTMVDCVMWGKKGLHACAGNTKSIQEIARILQQRALPK